MESFLLLDWGTAYTKATLFERVEGRLRLTGWGRGPTLAGAGLAGLDRSFQGALERLEAMRRRPLRREAGASLSEAGQPGVALALALLSAAPPLRLALLALTGRYSLESARRAIAGCHAELVASEALDEAPSLEAAIEAALSSAPEALVLVGGMEREPRAPSGMRTLAGLVARAVLALPEAERPVLIFAGHPAVAEELRPLFAARADLWVAANIRPRLETENLAALRREVDDTYLRRRRMGAAGTLAVLSGQRRGRASVQRPVLTAAQALERAAERWWQKSGRSTVLTWWGAAWAIVAAAGPRGVGVALRRRGVPDPASELASRLAWLPSPAPPPEALLAYTNARLRPASAPQSTEEVLLELAELRQLLAQAAAEALPQACEGQPGAWVIQQLLLGGGAVGDLGPLPMGPVLLAAVDATAPAGACELYLDPAGTVAAAGALAWHQPEEAAALLERESLMAAGTLLAPSGRIRPGSPALALRLRGGPQALAVEVRAGGLEWVPWPGEGWAEVKLRRGLSLGSQGEGLVHLQGGLLGLLLDARGRPLPDSPTPGSRRSWLGALGWRGG